MSLLDRYRRPIEQGLRSALRGETQLAEILRYHIGLSAEDVTASRLGKLIRPGLVLFTAEELGGRIDDALPAAVGLELIHGFSLIHDDVQDRDETRRGRPAVWARWGIAEAINAGDLMHAIALRTALDAGADAAKALAEATAEMIEGQSFDLAFEGRFVTVDEYMAMIDRKTGALFRCAFELGGRCAEAGVEVLGQLAEIGANIGRAFQVQDDLLGIWGDGETTGKPTGSDVRRKKKSYPVVVAYATASESERERLERIYATSTIAEPDVEWVIALLDRLEVADRACEAVREYSERATRAVGCVSLSDDGKRELLELIENLTRRET